MSLNHGFTVERTGDDSFDRLQQRIKKALDTIAAAATSSQLTDNARFVTVGVQDLQNAVRGPDVNAATSTLPASAAYQHLTGTATINFIQSGNWFDGAVIQYYVVTGLTFNHHAGGGSPSSALSLQMLSGAATAVAAGKLISFRRDDALGFWVQVA